MNYFEQLKEKYDDPKKAYLEYQLSKKNLRVFSCSYAAPEDIKKSMYLQENLNKYAEAIINSEKNIDVKSFLEIKDLIGFFNENEEHLLLIGVERESYIKLVTGMYEIDLRTASKNITWKSLEDVIVEENNNKPILSKEETQKLLEDTMNNYGLSSLTFGQVRTNKESLANVDESLNQLSVVIGCEKKQVGSNTFNIFYDTEDTVFAGYSNQHLGQQKLYLNERLSYDAFAHEWFHSIDNMLSVHNGLGDTHASETNFKSLQDLLVSSKEFNSDAIQEIKESINQKFLTHLSKIVDRFDRVGSVKSPEDFKEIVIKNYEQVVNGTWSKEQFVQESKGYQKKNDDCISYLASELELMKEFNENKLEISSFYKYAKIMDKNLQDAKIMNEDYSVTNLEMVARSFETFVDIKLGAKGLKNISSSSNSSSNESNYRPDKNEMKLG